MAPWVYDPHRGGVKISERLQAELLSMVKEYSHNKAWDLSHQLVLRFKGQFCYMDTVEEKDKRQLPLCRLRHFSKECFSLSLFTYSHDCYEDACFSGGSKTGSVIDALEICEPFII
jgi:hypothetical protein